VYSPSRTDDDTAMPPSTAYRWPLNESFIAEESATPAIRWPTAYLDTSIVSYLTSRLNRPLLVARRQRLTQVWWRRYRHQHALRISVRVLEEAEDGDPEASAARGTVLSEIDALPFDRQSQQLADKLVGAGMLPEKARSDAAHVAIAATNSIPLLVTWNCRYLANRITHRVIIRACETEGLRCPDICTPEQLMRTYTHVRSNS
jgi:hypothetical protein